MAALAPVATQPTASATPAKKSFYRRRLPCPPAVDFSSAEGKCVFAQALAQVGAATQLVASATCSEHSYDNVAHIPIWQADLCNVALFGLCCVKAE